MNPTLHAPRQEFRHALGKWWSPYTSTKTADGEVLAHDPGPDHGEVTMKVLDTDAEPARGMGDHQ